MCVGPECIEVLCFSILGDVNLRWEIYCIHRSVHFKKDSVIIAIVIIYHKDHLTDLATPAVFEHENGEKLITITTVCTNLDGSHILVANITPRKAVYSVDFNVFDWIERLVAIVE